MAYTFTNTTTPVAANNNGIAAAKPSTLIAQHRAAKDAFSSLNNVVNNLLDGQGGIGRRAMQVGYSFTIACMDNLEEAAKLQGWDDAAVQTGANPYCQPLKMLAEDMNPAIQTKISIWAKVFQSAHGVGITPDKFLEHLKRNHGMRRWYDAICLAEKSTNDNGKKDGIGKPSSGGGGGGKPKTLPPVPIDIVQRVGEAKKITYAIIDMDLLLCDSDAKAELEANLAFIGFAQVANDDCLAFLNNNDPRFGMKGAA